MSGSLVKCLTCDEIVSAPPPVLQRDGTNYTFQFPPTKCIKCFRAHYTTTPSIQKQQSPPDHNSTTTTTTTHTSPTNGSAGVRVTCSNCDDTLPKPGKFYIPDTKCTHCLLNQYTSKDDSNNLPNYKHATTMYPPHPTSKLQLEKKDVPPDVDGVVKGGPEKRNGMSSNSNCFSYSLSSPNIAIHPPHPINKIQLEKKDVPPEDVGGVKGGKTEKRSGKSSNSNFFSYSSSSSSTLKKIYEQSQQVIQNNTTVNKAVAALPPLPLPSLSPSIIAPRYQYLPMYRNRMMMMMSNHGTSTGTGTVVPPKVRTVYEFLYPILFDPILSPRTHSFFRSPPHSPVLFIYSAHEKNGTLHNIYMKYPIYHDL